MSSGKYFNTGEEFQLQPIDIGHRDYAGLISPDTAFWALVKKSQFGRAMGNSSLLRKYRKKEKAFSDELYALRFGLKPSAVYFNPTDRCNLNCSYCYIPESLRRNGRHMSARRLIRALEILKAYFEATLPKKETPQIIFHGAEPMLNREAVFAGMDKFAKYFRFGIQTNGTLLDKGAIEFLTSRGISIGLSLDGHVPQVADKLRRSWDGRGVSQDVQRVISQLAGYDNYSVICTVTKENMASQVKMVELLHGMGVPTCMLNPIRCTLRDSRRHKPQDADMAKHYLKALDRVWQLYRKTGQKLVVANFANILISIIAPSARRLMCDISPCGGGRCFFAVSAGGDLFPCSEFIGLKKFKGGNLFKDGINKILQTDSFRLVTERKIENIEPCSRCAIRHFCGAPCPAEAYEMNGSMDKPGAFCELYEEQVRYAFRLIADNKEDAYLWDKWDKDTTVTFNATKL